MPHKQLLYFGTPINVHVIVVRMRIYSRRGGFKIEVTV